MSGGQLVARVTPLRCPRARCALRAAHAMAFAARPEWMRLVRAIRISRAEVFKKTKKKRARTRAARKGTAKR